LQSLPSRGRQLIHIRREYSLFGGYEEKRGEMV
jgi:hypothetical protein